MLNCESVGGFRDSASPRTASRTVGYVRRLEGGGMCTLILVEAVPGDDNGDVKFVTHGARFEQHMGIGMSDLRALLPKNTEECDVRRWNGSSPDERESAWGLEGLFHTVDEVDAFVSGLATPQ